MRSGITSGHVVMNVIDSYGGFWITWLANLDAPKARNYLVRAATPMPSGELRAQLLRVAWAIDQASPYRRVQTELRTRFAQTPMEIQRVVLARMTPRGFGEICPSRYGELREYIDFVEASWE